MIFDKPTSMTDALRHQTLKKALALSPDIGSRDVQEFIPAQIREMAQQSARTTKAGYINDISTWIGRMLQPDVRIGPDGLVPTKSGESISPAQVRGNMKQALAALGYEPDPKKRGGLQDLSSDRRINLIIDTQLSMSRGYGRWREAQDPTILRLWPADELYRALNRETHRDWHLTWNNARAELGASTSATLAYDRDSGPFVALKNDPIWSAISRFGNPYPPFDYSSGMRVRDVTRARAVALGVINPDETVGAVQDPLTRPWAVSMQDTRSDIAEALQATFGERAMLQEEVLHILPDPRATLEELLYRSAKSEQATGAFAFLKQALQDTVSKIVGKPVKPAVTFEIDASHITHIRQTHGGNSELLRGQAPISNEDIANLDRIIKSGVPRAPTAAELKISREGAVAFDCADGIRVGGSYSAKRNRILVRTMYKTAGEK